MHCAVTNLLAVLRTGNHPGLKNSANSLHPFHLSLPLVNSLQGIVKSLFGLLLLALTCYLRAEERNVFSIFQWGILRGWSQAGSSRGSCLECFSVAICREGTQKREIDKEDECLYTIYHKTDWDLWKTVQYTRIQIAQNSFWCWSQLFTTVLAGKFLLGRNCLCFLFQQAHCRLRSGGIEGREVGGWASNSLQRIFQSRLPELGNIRNWQECR